MPLMGELLALLAPLALFLVQLAFSPLSQDEAAHALQRQLQVQLCVHAPASRRHVLARLCAAGQLAVWMHPHQERHRTASTSTLPVTNAAHAIEVIFSRD